MNTLETARYALAVIQAAWSVQPGKQLLIKLPDYWEEWTGHAKVSKKKEKKSLVSEFFAEISSDFNISKPEKKKDSYKKPTRKDTIPFDGDSVLFRDADFDDIVEDLHDTLPCTSKVEMTIRKRLRKATPIQFNKELCVEEQWDERVIERFEINKPKKLRKKADGFARNNLPRMIVEDCTFSSTNRIEIPQMITKGADNTAAHLRPEGILKYSPTIENMPQAMVMRDVIKSIGLGFTDWVNLSAKIRTWCDENPERSPWDAPLGPKETPLCDLALALNELEREQQEAIPIDWTLDPDIAAGFNADWQEPVREPITETVNTVGEYTYLRISRIPQAKEFNKSRYHKVPIREFQNLLQDMDDMDSSELAAWYKKIIKSKKGSFEQKDRFLEEYKRVLSSRAVFDKEITVLPPMTEPYDLDTDLPTFTNTENWQMDENGSIYESYRDDPSEDILDDIDGGLEFIAS